MSRVAFYNWLKQPGFAAAWAELPRKVISAHLPGVVAAVVRKAQEGDVAAARLLFQAAGLIGRDAVAGVTVAISTTNIHHGIIERADSWEQFQYISRAVKEAQQRAGRSDDGVQQGNGKVIDITNDGGGYPASFRRF